MWPCCDLLLNLYLWNIKHTFVAIKQYRRTLWFAFEFVSLKYQTHLKERSMFIQIGCDLLLNLYLWNIKHTNPCVAWIHFSVVICFWICIFEISNTPSLFQSSVMRCCDLLLNLYLWNIKHTTGNIFKRLIFVVICFWICIFEISNTPWYANNQTEILLWFAFEFVSLKYQTHHDLCKSLVFRYLQRFLENKKSGV